MNDEEAIKFINSLVKNLQVLCHGSVEFKQKVEVIGHLYLNVDSDVKFDYIVNEKVCRNEQDSTTFVSNSFHAGPKKTIAERKKELEEELAKLQREQVEQYSNQQQTFHMNNHRGNGSSRMNPRDNSSYQNDLVQQIALKRQASRNPLPDRDEYQSQFKFPKSSFEEMNAFQAKISQHVAKRTEKRKDHDQESRSSSTLRQSAPSTPIDISAIKKEYISSQQEESSSCIFDRGRTGSDGSDTNISCTNETVFPGMTLEYKPSPQNFNNSPFHPSQTTSPSASLGSPYHSPMLQSPGVSELTTEESRKRLSTVDIFVCECGKSFRTSSGYADHKRTHEGNFRYFCPICSKGYNNKQQFIGHMNKHSNNKPFTCEWCGKAFTLKHNLVQHTARCIDKKNDAQRTVFRNSTPQNISGGAQCFPSEGSTTETEGDKKLFQCDICNKSFRSTTGYNLHMNTHKGIFKYHCEVCNKGYQNIDNLKGHMTTHFANKLFYSCKVCGKEYRYKSEVLRHEKMNCDEKNNSAGN